MRQSVGNRVQRGCGVACLACLAVWMSVGCGSSISDVEAGENLHPTMGEAKQCMRKGDVDQALKLYEELLLNEPHMAKAHLEAGLLYDSEKQDYIRAIYHYQQYLTLRPDSEKRDLIEELVGLARLSFAASLPDQPSDAIREVGRLRQEVARLKGELLGSRNSVRALKQSLQEANQQLASTGGEVGATAVLAARAGDPGAAADPVLRVSGPRAYRVRSGDNLTEIAKEMYDDGTKWRLIFNANREVLKQPDDLQAGQTLVIPSLSNES